MNHIFRELFYDSNVAVRTGEINIDRLKQTIACDIVKQI